MNYADFDHIIVGFSGGKDSTAAFLKLLDMGIPKEKIELWHHCVDGAPGTPVFMDWECTEDYCRKFAAAFDVPIYYSWLDGGFKREMLRVNEAKAATYFETPNGVMKAGGKSTKLGTRLKFPQVSGELRTRWCSAYLKIDVFRIAINNDPRFSGKSVLLVTGERAEEGSYTKDGQPRGRAAYAVFEEETHYYRYRAVHAYSEQEVWAIIEKHNVVVHPAYYLGFGRCSCKFCIFGNANQFATAAYISPYNANLISDYETEFGTTIKRKESVKQLIAKGNVYEAAAMYPNLLAAATSYEYNYPIFTNKWQLPAGAYGENAGPT